MKMDSRMPTSICIATPAYGDDCKTGYVESLLKTCLQLRELSIGISFVTVSSALIALGRNLAVDFFIKQTNATHLLFVDADLRWRVNDLVRMLSFSERDVLAAVCPRRAL
jgi:hypothetical protein